MAGALSADRLLAARAQDAAGWTALAVALALAPWAAPWDWLDVPRPDPPAAGPLAAVLLVVAAAVLVRSRSRRAIALAAAADVAGAVVLLAWLARGGVHGTGAVIVGLAAAGLAVQAAFDAAMLRVART